MENLSKLHPDLYRAEPLGTGNRVIGELSQTLPGPAPCVVSIYRSPYKVCGWHESDYRCSPHSDQREMYYGPGPDLDAVFHRLKKITGYIRGLY